MGFKTQYNEMTLKELCNMAFIGANEGVILYDYETCY